VTSTVAATARPPATCGDTGSASQHTSAPIAPTAAPISGKCALAQRQSSSR
jgi:hypothetical protein